MSQYRFGVRDPAFGGAVLWYDQETYEDAYRAWCLLREYGRDGLGLIVQQRNSDGQWREVQPQ